MALLVPDVTGQGDDLLQEEPINSSLPCTGFTCYSANVQLGFSSHFSPASCSDKHPPACIIKYPARHNAGCTANTCQRIDGAEDLKAFFTISLLLVTCHLAGNVFFSTESMKTDGDRMLKIRSTVAFKDSSFPISRGIYTSENVPLNAAAAG